MKRFIILFTLFTLAFGAACSDGGDDDSGYLNSSARQELLDSGMDRYFGTAQPVREESVNDSTAYYYDPADGPVCIFGDPFVVSVREGSSPNVRIHLQGGGACWSSMMACTPTASAGVPKGGINQPPGDHEFPNPLEDWSVVFVPYCDGSVFSGDNDFEMPWDEDETMMRYHHGLANLSAALDLAAEKFPNAEKVLLTGSSAGGYGTIMGTAVTRLKFPETPLYVINDAGPGLQNFEWETHVQQRIDEWKYDQFIPASCTACDKGHGHFTDLIAWALENDSNLKLGMFSAYEDNVIGNAFLLMAGPDYKELLLRETGRIHDAYPDRFNRFMINGTQHTALGGGSYFSNTVDGEVLYQWVEKFINDDPGWTDRLEAAFTQ